MAICDFCKQDMMSDVSCTLTCHEGETKDRIPYPSDAEVNCHDCRTPPGGLHHPGCDMERCPECGGQAICCRCAINTEQQDEWG